MNKANVSGDTRLVKAKNVCQVRYILYRPRHSRAVCCTLHQVCGNCGYDAKLCKGAKAVSNVNSN
jgi:hypothetical protein